MFLNTALTEEYIFVLNKDLVLTGMDLEDFL